MAMLVSSVEEGSLSAAARKLRIPVATLTRNVNDLEALVGTKLLIRSTRKLELTDAGADYVASAKQILEQVDEQERRAAGEFTAPRGELVITTPVQIARLRVLPVIDQFLASYPEIRIRLIQSDRNVDLIDSHADVAIRVGRLRDSSLVAARVGSLRVVVVASKELQRKHGEPGTPEDLRGYPCIVFDSPSLSPWRFRNPDTGQIFTMAEVPRLLVSSPDAAVDAAIDSIGATLRKAEFYSPRVRSRTDTGSRGPSFPKRNADQGPAVYRLRCAETSRNACRVRTHSIDIKKQPAVCE
jgi:DNA-binding transcriptional LysR family regulator